MNPAQKSLIMQQMYNANPIDKGALSGMQAAKESVGLDARERQNKMAQFIGHLGMSMAIPGHASPLAAMAAHAPQAIQAAQSYENDIVAQNRAYQAKQEALENQRLMRNFELMKYEDALEQQEKKNSLKGRELDIYAQKQASGSGGAKSNIGKILAERDQAVEQYGEDSPQVKAIDAYIHKTTSKQFAPDAMAKLMIAKEDIKNGFLPGSNGTVQITPEQQEEYNNLIDLKLLKASTDTDTRKRALFAKNLVMSIDNANVDDLVRYSGPGGAVKLKAEQALELAGLSSEDYKKHQEAKEAILLETQELRQFLGTSITPAMDSALREMVDATSLTTDPVTAKRMINKSRGIIRKQLNTFQSALKSTNPYKNESSPQAPSGVVKGIIHGQEATVPASMVDAFVRDGGKIL